MSSQRKIKSTLETEARYPFASTDNWVWLLDKVRRTSTISVFIILQFFTEKFAKFSPSYRGGPRFFRGGLVPPFALPLLRACLRTLWLFFCSSRNFGAPLTKGPKRNFCPGARNFFRRSCLRRIQNFFQEGGTKIWHIFKRSFFRQNYFEAYWE